MKYLNNSLNQERFPTQHIMDSFVDEDGDTILVLEDGSLAEKNNYETSVEIAEAMVQALKDPRNHTWYEEGKVVLN